MQELLEELARGVRSVEEREGDIDSGDTCFLEHYADLKEKELIRKSGRVGSYICLGIAGFAGMAYLAIRVSGCYSS